jgi:hypothetical protein
MSFALLKTACSYSATARRCPENFRSTEPHNSRAAFMPAASHWAATSTNANAAPVSLHLKASFDISQFSAANQVILRTLQQYGWNNDDLHNLDEVNASDFEVVEMSPIYTQTNLPTGAAPVISSFTASAQTMVPLARK